MREFKKSAKLDHVSYDVRGPVLEEADRMQARGIDILKLNTGNPATFGFKAPNEIIHDVIANARESEGYSDSKGIFSARKAIQQYYQLKGFENFTINDIYTGNGVSELITMCMQGLINNGDEVLVPMPDYPLWTASVSLAGGNAVHYVCDEQAEWFPDIDDIKSKVTDRTKAIVIINPNNPTGALYSEELLQDIIKVAREHQLIIFSDEIYDRLVMDGLEHTSIAALAPDLFTVTLNGLSKSHRVAGFRCGWMVLSGEKTHVQDYIEGLNMLASMRLCSNVLSQHIIQTALGGYQSIDKLLLPGGRIYEQREFITKALNDIPGISAVKPKAAFYIFPKIDTEKFNILDDEQFVLDFLHEKHILLVHGKGFNMDTPDHFRIVYLPKLEDLSHTTDSLADFLAGYRQKTI
ncbi:pyridoxal phosphate-dependent aminotransferase [Vagococcus acidifermentans]|uniref:alanine transaminase n=1 Tax=Vagococcus acidifermentans TaxID=564710 RepID=A0A430AWR1_9ENTE|nr:pyridoxal phosphate-dependent aminotransferase [Vagococcus acidifermentans]RSU12485.1 aminotransferase [Vagococcus acidifermentans]